MATDHVLVTGGTGFIGRALCPQLLAVGYEVTVLTRDPGRAASLLPAGVCLIGDLEQLDPQRPLTALVNLAGEPLADRRWSQARKRLFYDSRVAFTEGLFTYFSERAGYTPGTVVSGSAIGYYGPRGEEWIGEDAAPGVCFSSELCRAWESMACQFENLGARVCCLRTGIVLGPGGGALGAMLPAFRLGLGGPMGSGRQWMSWIHRDDMVAIIVTALRNEAVHGPVNATAPNPVTNREFAGTLGGVLSRPAFFTMPGFAVRTLFGELADELLLTGQRVVPNKVLARGFRFSYPDLEPALRQILARH